MLLCRSEVHLHDKSRAGRLVSYLTYPFLCSVGDILLRSPEYYFLNLYSEVSQWNASRHHLVVKANYSSFYIKELVCCRGNADTEGSLLKYKPGYKCIEHISSCISIPVSVFLFRILWHSDSRVEAGSNTSTVTLRVVGGDEKGSLESETVKYGHESHGSWTRKCLHWQRPGAIVNDRPVLSSERAPHINKPATVWQ
jgi:hypothetical protein